MREIIIATPHTKTQFIKVGNTDYGYVVQDNDKLQNIDKFQKGLSLIENMSGKRGEFLNHFVARMALPMSMVMGEETSRVFIDERYCNFIAFVCDIANHKELKDWNGVYDKAFPKFVANLCYNYFLDDDFETYKKGEKPQFNFYSRIIRL